MMKTRWLTASPRGPLAPLVIIAALQLAALLLAACGSDDGTGASAPPPFNPGGSDSPGPASTTPGASGGENAPSVANYNRPAGMPIGQGSDGPAPGEGDLGGTPIAPAQPDDGELEIPVFEDPTANATPPCNGCIELNVLVDDINQRDDFVFTAGGVNVTRVVWTIIVPFNSDQLFVQPFVNESYGTYTDLDANAFTVDTPVQLVHQFSGTANTVGLAIGSAGAWTGNQTMQVFVDSVTLEGAASGSRSFDGDAQGVASRTNAHQPRVVYHP